MDFFSLFGLISVEQSVFEIRISRCLTRLFISSTAGTYFYHFNGVSGHELEQSDQTAGRRTNRISTADACIEPRGADAVCLGPPSGVKPPWTKNQRKDPPNHGQTRKVILPDIAVPLFRHLLLIYLVPYMRYRLGVSCWSWNGCSFLIFFCYYLFKDPWSLLVFFLQLQRGCIFLSPLFACLKLYELDAPFMYRSFYQY